MNIKIKEKLRFDTQKLITYGLWLMLVVLAFSVFQNVTRVLQTRAEIQKEREKVAKMEDQNNELERRMEEAQNSFFIEKQVRNKLGLAKAGESLVILPDEDTLRKLAPQTINEENTLPDSNWKKWEKLFF